MSSPTVIIGYPGPCLDREVQDIVLYLRPETNGVRTESCMLRVLRDDPSYRDLYSLVYLANLPSEFMAAQRVVERRYALRIRFAREGGAAFTPTMKRAFEAHFGAAFDTAPVVGAWEALDRLAVSAEDLFEVWVDESDFARIHQQSVKRIRGLYVVNYDIPARLRRETQASDVFVMVLRSFAPYARIHALIDRMCAALEEARIISDRRPRSRIFHYSTGPFAQVLDGSCYVYDPAPVERARLSCYAYLLGRGVRPDVIDHALERQIMRFATPSGVVERHIFEHTYECSYAEALERLQGAVE
jgi:hypothetical protein